jgi:Helix-turn-helix domain
VKGRPRKRNDDTKIEVRDARSTNWSWFENEAMDRYAGEIGPYAWTVYTYLIRRANKNGQCYPSYKTMATDLKISRTSVYNAVRVLEEKNLIKVESRLDEESGDPTSHLYTVLGVSPGDTPRSPDEPGYITTHTGVYHDVNPNNTQLTRPLKKRQILSLNASGLGRVAPVAMTSWHTTWISSSPSPLRTACSRSARHSATSAVGVVSGSASCTTDWRRPYRSCLTKYGLSAATSRSWG